MFIFQSVSLSIDISFDVAITQSIKIVTSKQHRAIRGALSRRVMRLVAQKVELRSPTAIMGF